ncbi:MAG TPA: hypothetical protein PLG55_08515 [Methanospirillum sp.]|nr:hypothetical protein [Methanospirillum sp.]HPY60750.1 hypothetical protein [Methanospirillum sp.]
MQRIRDKHGDKLLPWMESLREQGLEDYEIVMQLVVMQLVHAHGGME